MDSEPTNLYLITTRELHVFTAIAGLWLKTRKPAVVRETYRILRECGVLGSIDALNMSIRKLIKAKWLEPRPYGEKLHRYVPTLKGFAEFFDAINSMWKNFMHDVIRSLVSGELSNVNISPPPLFDCLNKYVDVSAVERLGRTLALLKKAAALSIAPPKYQELVRAVEDARAISDVPQELLDTVQSDLPSLECLVEFHLVQSAAFDFTEIEISSENFAKEALDVINALADALYKLTLYCARKGVTVASEVAEIIKSSFPV